MSVETGISLSAAWMARSPALLAFGGDSAIELFSAVVVLLRFNVLSKNSDAERPAARVAGGLLFALAAYVTVIAVMSLRGHNDARPTYLGISVLIAAAAIMPLLAKEKRKLSATTGSAALRADAAQSGLCAYFSLIALAGLMVSAVWHIGWADPVAALVVVPLVLRESKEAMRGKPAVAAERTSLHHGGVFAYRVYVVCKPCCDSCSFDEQYFSGNSSSGCSSIPSCPSCGRIRSDFYSSVCPLRSSRSFINAKKTGTRIRT